MWCPEFSIQSPEHPSLIWRGLFRRVLLSSAPPTRSLIKLSPEHGKTFTTRSEVWTHNTCCSSVSRYLVLGWPEVGTLEQWWLWNEIELQTNLRLKLYYENCDLLILLSSHPSPLCEDELRCARWWPGWAGWAQLRGVTFNIIKWREKLSPVSFMNINTEYRISTQHTSTHNMQRVARYLYM